MNFRFDFLTGALRLLRPFEWERKGPEKITEFRALLRANIHDASFDLS